MSSRHLRETCEEALCALEQDVVRMGSLAGDLLRRAVGVLKRQDVQAAEAVIADDDVVDCLHLDLKPLVDIPHYGAAGARDAPGGAAGLRAAPHGVGGS